MPHFGELPTIHHTRHEDGGVDEIDVSGLHGQTLWVPYNGKIADITHPDVLKHFLDLETALPETRKIITVFIFARRIAGTGGLRAYPNEGADIPYEWGIQILQTVIIADGTQRLQYSLTVANDDFDLYCLGYVVEI